VLVNDAQAKVENEHRVRNLHKFYLDNKLISIVNTKHGLYRTLTSKDMKVEDLVNVILSIGNKEIRKHMRLASDHYNHLEDSWEKKIDYVIAIYDAVNEIVLMIGLHLHLKRMTIVTVIPRVKNVAANNVHAVYRIDSDATRNTYINEKVSSKIRIKHIKVN
jgi:DNA-binding cell septation regulator SpoVG